MITDTSAHADALIAAAKRINGRCCPGGASMLSRGIAYARGLGGRELCRGAGTVSGAHNGQLFAAVCKAIAAGDFDGGERLIIVTGALLRRGGISWALMAASEGSR